MTDKYKPLKTMSYVLSACLFLSPLCFSKPNMEQPYLETSQSTIAIAKTVTSQDISKIFAPQTKRLDYRFDYTVLDAALRDVVIQMGPSLRRFKRKPRSQLGSRIIPKSQNSPYRLEGSRIDFHGLSDDYKNSLTAYKDDLIRIANDVDIQSLDRDEQLAFWMNLHNVILIDIINKKHPASYPARLEIGENGAKLHDAKLVTIQNTPLSLKNIREDIVYANWNDPNVIYGFFRGDISSPVLKEYALTKYNVDYVLPSNAYEYITSLRGFHTTRKNRKISKIYDEARPYFFPNWPTDLVTHLEDQLQIHTLTTEINQNKPWAFIKYDDTIADLWGGNKSYNSASINTSHAPIGASPVLLDRSNRIRELNRKRKSKKSYTVIIEDIYTSATLDIEIKPSSNNDETSPNETD